MSRRWTSPTGYRPDPAELLRRSGFRRTWRDSAEDFIADVRGRPLFALVCTVGGFAAGMVATLGVALVIMGVSA